LLFTASCSNDEIVNHEDPPPPSGISLIDYEPSWSPDGHTIAYFHIDTSNATTGIFLIDTNGTNKRQLVSGYCGSPDFSPDGEWITFFSSQIYKMKINGDSLTRLTNGGNNYYPSWSPDGKWIAYHSDFNDPTGSKVIWKVKSDGSENIDIGEHGTGESIMPAWSPDNSKLVYLKYFTGSSGETEIAIMSSSGQTSYRLTNNNLWESFPKFSADGQTILFTQQHKSSINFQLYTININGSDLKKVTDTQGYSADYSPNGDKLVYCDCSSTSGRLWIMNKDGSSKRQLTY